MRRIAKAAIRSTQHNLEERLTLGRNRSACFSYVNSKTDRCSSAAKIVINDGATDYETSNIFSRDLMNNFSAPSGSCIDPHLSATAGDSALMFNCNVAHVLVALVSQRRKRAWNWRKSACLNRHFFIDRTQQVKIRECLSEQADVISGTIQGSVLGPICTYLLILCCAPLKSSVEPSLMSD